MGTPNSVNFHLDISNVLSTNVDADARIIYLRGEINEELFDWFLPAFTILDRGNKPITIKITSGGGDTYIGFAIYDLIRNAKNKVIAEVYGRCYSIAALILVAADVRMITELSGVLIHDTIAILHEEQTVKHSQMVLQASELKRLCHEYYNKIALRTGQKLDFIKELGSEDKILSSSEALQYGFVHKIIKGKKQ
jgi:ATP-dependent Clp protease protease subunit